MPRRDWSLLRPICRLIFWVTFMGSRLSLMPISNHSAIAIPIADLHWRWAAASQGMGTGPRKNFSPGWPLRARFWVGAGGNSAGEAAR